MCCAASFYEIRKDVSSSIYQFLFLGSRCLFVMSNTLSSWRKRKYRRSPCLGKKNTFRVFPELHITLQWHNMDGHVIIGLKNDLDNINIISNNRIFCYLSVYKFAF